MAKVTYSDNGMDFNSGLDFDFDMTPKKVANMSKREVITEAGKGFYDGLKSEATDARKWKESLRAHMPKGYSQGMDAYEETSQTVSDLYNHAEKEIKPLLGQLAFKLDSFVPESLETIKKFTTDLKDRLYDAPNFNGKQSLDATIQAGVQKMLGETFQQEREFEAEREVQKDKRKLVEDSIRESIENRKRENEFKLFANMNNNIARLTAYKMNTGIAVDKKSLELSMRKYMLLGQMHQQQINQGKMLQEQMSALIKNTSLPDSVKMNASDRFMNSMKNRITGGVQDRMFKHGSLLTTGLDRLKSKGKEQINEFAQALQMVMSLTGSLDMMFGDDAFESVPKTLGGMLGMGVGSFARNKLAKPIANKLKGFNGVEDVLNQVRLYAQNPNYAIEDFKKTSHWKKIEGTKLEGVVEKLFETIQESLSPMTNSGKLDRGISFNSNSLEAGVFTKRLQLVQTEVVPGYLARILRAVNQLRASDPSKVPLLRHNPLTGQFQNEKDVEKSITETLMAESRKSSVGYQTKIYAGEIGETIGVKDVADQLVIGRLLMETAKTGNTINEGSIRASNTYKESNKKTKAVLDKLIASVSKGKASNALLGDLEERRAGVRGNMSSHSALMQRMIDAGLGEGMQKLGYVDQDEAGELSQNRKFLDKLTDESLTHGYKDSSTLSLRDQAIRELLDEDRALSKQIKDEGMMSALTSKRGLLMKNKTMEQRIKERIAEKKKVTTTSALTLGKPVGTRRSDEATKDKFQRFDAQFALDGINRIPVTEWNFKTDKGTDHKKIGPMSQALHKQFGNKAAPGAKEIDLVSMNGINMAAIQALSDNQTSMEQRFKSSTNMDPSKKKLEFLMFAVNESVKDMHATLKKKSLGFDFNYDPLKEKGTQAKEALNNLNETAKAKAKILVKSGNYYIDTVQTLALSALSDIYDKGTEAKDKVSTLAKDFWSNNKDTIKRKKDEFIGKAYDFYGKTLDFGKDMLYNQLPAAANEAWAKLKQAKERMKSLISGPKDVYVKNGDSPVVLADRMRGGYYVDTATGEVIRSIDSLLKLKGDLYDTAKQSVVLTRSDMVEGVYDNEGNRLRTLADTGVGLAMAGAQFLVDKAKQGIDFIKGKGNSLGSAVGEWWKNPSKITDVIKSALTGIKQTLFGSKGFTLYDKRQITVLAQIRDLLAIGKRRKLVSHVYNRNLEDQTFVNGKSFLAAMGFGAFDPNDPSTNPFQGMPTTNNPNGTQGPGNPFQAAAQQGGPGGSGFPGMPTTIAGFQQAAAQAKAAANKFGQTPFGARVKGMWQNSKAAQKFGQAKHNHNFVGPMMPPGVPDPADPQAAKTPGFFSRVMNRQQDPNMPRKGETVVLEQNGTTIYQDENGVYRSVPTPAKRMGAGQRIDNYLKKKHQERRLSGLIDGSYTDHEMEGMEDGPDYVGPMERMSNAGSAAKQKSKDLARRFMQSKAVQAAKDKTGQAKDASKQFVKDSGQQAVNLVGKLSANPAFQSLMKGISGFNKAYVAETEIGSGVKKPSYTDSMLAKLGIQNMTSKGTNALNQQEGTRWGRFKQDMADRGRDISERTAPMRGRMRGRAGKAWEGMKNVGSFIGSGLSAGAGFLKNFMGETVNEQSNNDFGTALNGGANSTTNIRGLGDGVKGKNDADGDGDRDGGSTEMMRTNQNKEAQRKQEEGQKAQEAAKRAADSSLKYKSSENAIDKMMKGASGLIDFLKENAGSMFSGAMSMLEMIPGLGKIARLGGKGVMALGRGLKGVGKMGLGKLAQGAGAARGALQAGGMRGLGSLALNSAHKGLTIARAGMIATGTTSGAIGGLALTAAKGILTVLASPLFLKAAVIAGVGYGIYKTYKYFTRNSVDMFQKLRLVQYGFKEDHSQQHRIVALENYFMDGRVSPHNGANFIQQKMKEEEILEIMDIDPKDTNRKQAFYLWLNSRFKPFFLKHISAIYEADPKVKLSDASKLEFEPLGKYLDKAQYLDGPYNVEESPFDAEEKVVDTSADIPAMVEKLRHSKKKPKENKKSNVASVADDPKLGASLNAHKAAQAEAAKNAAAKAAGALDEAKNRSGLDAAKARQEQSGKGLTNTPVSTLGEDGNQPTTITNKAASTPGVASVSLGSLPVAQGPLLLDQDGMKFLNVKRGVNVNKLQPNVLRYLSAMAAEYGKMTGNSIPINDGYRSYEEQAALYQRMPGKAAKPGGSMHEHGLAFDIDSKVANQLDKLGLLRKYGFTRPVGGEAWHVEPAGVQLDIERAKKDPGWAMAQIEASPGRGGGGYGSQAGSTMKRRNPSYAAELWKASTTSTLSPAPKPQEANTTAAAPSAPTSGLTAPGDGSKASISASPAAAYSAVNQNTGPGKQSSEGEKEPTGSTISAGFTPKAGSVVEQTKEAAAAAAKKANINPTDLQLFAAVESRMGQDTKSGVSNAKGPFQFLPGTWNEMVKNYGSRYGVTSQDTPEDPYKSGLMTAAYMKENEPKIKKHKSAADIRDFYMAHMLGGGGVQTFLKMRPEDIPATMMPGAARNNPSVFYKDSRNLKNPFTRTEVGEALTKKFNNLGQAFNIPVSLSGDAPKENNVNPDSGTGGGETAISPSASPSTPSSSSSGNLATATAAAPQKASVQTSNETLAEVKNNQMEKQRPKEAMRGNAEAISGVGAAMERSANAAEKLLDTVNKDVVPTLRGIHEVLMQMYSEKSNPSNQGGPSPAAKSPQASTSQVPTSSLNRTRKYGT